MGKEDRKGKKKGRKPLTDKTNPKWNKMVCKEKTVNVRTRVKKKGLEKEKLKKKGTGKRRTTV